MFYAFENCFFNFSYQFLSDKVEIIFWENRGTTLKSAKSKTCRREDFRKRFRNYISFESKCSLRLKIVFFVAFFINFYVTKLKPFSGREKDYLRNCLNEKFVKRSI